MLTDEAKQAVREHSAQLCDSDGEPNLAADYRRGDCDHLLADDFALAAALSVRASASPEILRDIEQIVLRRSVDNRIEGYTLETAKEIGEVVRSAFDALTAERDRYAHERAHWYDVANGTPCAEIRWQQEREKITADLAESNRLLSAESGRLAAALKHIEGVDTMREALRNLIMHAKMLQENAEGCAANHYGGDIEVHGLPPWLFDTQASISNAEDALAQGERT